MIYAWPYDDTNEPNPDELEEQEEGLAPGK